MEFNAAVCPSLSDANRVAYLFSCSMLKAYLSYNISFDVVNILKRCYNCVTIFQSRHSFVKWIKQNAAVCAPIERGSVLLQALHI
jgi:hypothetical protein